MSGQIVVSVLVNFAEVRVDVLDADQGTDLIRHFAVLDLSTTIGRPLCDADRIDVVVRVNPATLPRIIDSTLPFDYLDYSGTPGATAPHGGVTPALDT